MICSMILRSVSVHFRNISFSLFRPDIALVIALVITLVFVLVITLVFAPVSISAFSSVLSANLCSDLLCCHFPGKTYLKNAFSPFPKQIVLHAAGQILPQKNNACKIIFYIPLLLHTSILFPLSQILKPAPGTAALLRAQSPEKFPRQTESPQIQSPDKAQTTPHTGHFPAAART